MKPGDYLVKMAGKCVPGIRERPPRNGHDYVFGEHFLRSFYTIFDREKDRVGFSQSSEARRRCALKTQVIFIVA